MHCGATAGGGCPPALSQASLLWALSLEMGRWLEEAEGIAWPQVWVPAAMQSTSKLPACLAVVGCADGRGAGPVPLPDGCCLPRVGQP
jgi:hypothetical protein